MDSAYTAKYLSMARLLWDCSEGIPLDIPADYCEHLRHEYIDGDVSMVPLLPKFDYVEELEDFEWDEAVEMLGKVRPEDWPNFEDIESISLEEVLRVYDEDASGFDFVEDNLSTAE